MDTVLSSARQERTWKRRELAGGRLWLGSVSHAGMSIRAHVGMANVRHLAVGANRTAGTTWYSEAERDASRGSGILSPRRRGTMSGEGARSVPSQSAYRAPSVYRSLTNCLLSLY